MKLFKKSRIVVAGLILMMLVSLCGCQNNSSSNTSAENDGDIPTIRIAGGYSLHSGIFTCASSKGEAFKDMGVYLNPVGKEQYELISNGKKLAIINRIMTKGSSESAVLLGQKQVDGCMNSITGMMSARDRGTQIKVLCPIHTDGIGMVFPAGTDVNGWEGVKEYISNSNTPVKIGYHSPVSAPRVVLESALTEQGFTVTEDPNNTSADVLLVDLKGTGNLLSAFTSKTVEAWVGPSHFPETAEVEGIGKMVLELKDFPPEGQWLDFPCCVLAVREEVLQQNPEVFQALVQLLHNSAEWCTENKKEVAAINAEKIGIPAEAIENATITFTTEPTEKWFNGVDLYLQVLNRMDKLSGELKDKNLDDISNDFFDFSFLENIQN